MQWRWAGQVSINKYAVEGRRSEETGGFNTTIKMHDPELFDGFAKELLWTLECVEPAKGRRNCIMCLDKLVGCILIEA
jgi:hypothetical protein